MLVKLTVTNYALIDSLEFVPGQGMNIITGETGAGKSILLGAISLILGQRADSDSLLDKSRKCVVEGEFRIRKKNSAVFEFLKRESLDLSDTILLRREINPEGKSRAFINDTPVNLGMQKELGSLLVEIHSQHETLLLNQGRFQLSVLDAFSGKPDLVEKVQSLYAGWKNTSASLEKILEEEKHAAAEHDYIVFQVNELREANLKENEQQSLEEEEQRLTHAGEITAGLAEASEAMDGSQDNIITGTGHIISLLNGLIKYHPAIQEVLSRLQSIHVEMKDISGEIQSIRDKITADPERLQQINDRLNQIYRLQKKHHATTIEELIVLEEKMQQKLDSLENMAHKIAGVRKDCDDYFRRLTESAAALSDARKKAVPVAENAIRKMLSMLGMPSAACKISHEILNEPLSSGVDKIRFLFSANKGVDYSDISRVASGGELSRVMLAIKSSVAKLMDLPTIIFDEIDTGVSGETALRVGQVMQQLSQSHQVLAITHLPQIAGKGREHFTVYKEVTEKRTFSRIRKLNGEERVVEIARMLSGNRPTAIALENAKELLQH